MLKSGTILERHNSQITLWDLRFMVQLNYFRKKLQCWKVVAEAQTTDRLIRATLQDIEPQVIKGQPGHYSCRQSPRDSHKGLIIYDGKN